MDKKAINRMIAGLFIAMAAGIFAMGTTNSYFNDAAAAAGNILTAGSLDLKVGNIEQFFNGVSCGADMDEDGDFGGSGTCRKWSLKDLADEDKFFNFNGIAPGNEGANVISVKSEGANAWLCFGVSNLSNKENDVLPQETDAGDNAVSDIGELSSAIQLLVWRDNGDGQIGSGETPIGTQSGIYKFSNLDTIGIYDKNSGDYLTAGETKYIGVKWCFGKWTQEAGDYVCDGSATANPNVDITQTDSLTADLVLRAEQSDNNNDFVCGVSPEETSASGGPITGN